MVFGGLLWRRERLSVDLAGASSLPRAGCSDATPVASTYEGFLIGEGVRQSTSSCRMCVPPQALYLPNEDWSAWGTRAEGLSSSKPLAFNFDNHALSSAIAHQQSDGYPPSGHMGRLWPIFIVVLFYSEASSLVDPAGRAAHSDRLVAQNRHELQPSLEQGFFEQNHPVDKSGVPVDHRK